MRDPYESDREDMAAGEGMFRQTEDEERTSQEIEEFHKQYVRVREPSLDRLQQILEIAHYSLCRCENNGDLCEHCEEQFQYEHQQKEWLRRIRRASRHEDTLLASLRQEGVL